MRKKWLATLLSLAMVLSLLPTWAIAEEGPTVIGEIGGLVAAAAESGSYELADELILEGDLEVTSDATFDLNGQKLTIPGGVKLAVTGNLKIVNSLSTAGGVSVDGDIIVESGATLDISELPYSFGENKEGGLIAGQSGTLNVQSGATVKYLGDWASSQMATIGGMNALVINNHNIAIAEVGAIAVVGDTTYYCTKASTETKPSEWSKEASVAQIGGAGYPTLEAAIAAVEDDDTIKLLDNVTLSSTVEINNDLTIDLNGHNITGGSVRALWFKNGESTITGTGTITSATNGGSSVIRVGEGANDNSASLTVDEDVVVETTGSSYGITVFSGTKGGGRGKDVTLVMNGTVNSINMPAISGCGNAENGKTYITVNGKVTTENENAIYFPCDGKLVVNGTVTGDGGIEMKAGTAEVMVGEVNIGADAVITATGTVGSNPGNHNDGCSTLGYALAAVENSGYLGKPTIIVNGGTINGTVGVFVDSEVDESKKANITITGGTFSSNVSDYCAEGYECTGSDTSWTVTEQEGHFKAQIGGTKYATLAEAVAAVPTSGTKTTITMLDNVTVETQITIDSGKNIVLDLNGNTISTGTTNNLFLIDGAKVELAGTGTIDLKSGDPNPYYGIQLKGSAEDVADYSVLKVGKNVIITGTNTYGVQVYKANADLKNSGVVVDIAGRIEATYGMTVNGYFNNTTTNVPKITVEEDAYCHGLYAAGYGVYDIYGTVEFAEYGIAIKSGKLNIYDSAHIHCTGADATPTDPYGNGVRASGAAIGIEGTAGYAANIEINISGGMIESENGVAVYGYGETFTDAVKSLSITGGEFKTGSSDSKYTSDFFGPFDKTGFITGGTFSKEPNATFLATGYEVSEVGGKWIVGKGSVKIDVEEFTVYTDDVEGEDDTGIAEKLVNNPALAKAPDAGIDTLVKTGGTVAADVEDALKEAGATGTIAAGDIVSYVKVAPTAALVETKEAEEDPDVTMLLFDVKPMVKVVGTETEIELTPEMLGDGDKFATPVTFRLPLTDNFHDTIKITHYENEEFDPDTCEVIYRSALGEAGGKYVELAFDHFSPVAVEQADDADLQVGDTLYYAEDVEEAVELSLSTGKPLVVLCRMITIPVPDGEVLEVTSNGADVRKKQGSTGSIHFTDKTLKGHNVVLSAQPDTPESGSYAVGDTVTVSLVGKDNGTLMTSYYGAQAVVTFDNQYLAPILTDSKLPDGWVQTSDKTVAFYKASNIAESIENGVISQIQFTALKKTAVNDSTDNGTNITVSNSGVAPEDEATVMAGLLYTCSNGEQQNVKIELGVRNWAEGHDPNQVYTDPKTVYDGNEKPCDTTNYCTDETPAVTANVEYFTKSGDDYAPSGTPKNAGEYYVRFYVPADEKYEKLESDYLKYTIQKAPLYIDTSTAIGEPVYSADSVQLLKGDITAYTDSDKTIQVALTGIKYKYKLSTHSGEGAWAKVKSAATIGTDCEVKYWATSTDDNYVVEDGSFEVTILSPVYQVVKCPDYVAGGTLVMVFTDDDACYTCDGNKMFDASALGYKTQTKDLTARGESDGSLATAGTASPQEWSHVYVMLVASNDANAGNVAVSTSRRTNGVIVVNEDTNGRLDVNYDDAGLIDVNDAVAVMLSYNKGVTHYSEEELNDYMGTILRADINCSGKVDGADAGLIEAVVRPIPAS